MCKTLHGSNKSKTNSEHPNYQNNAPIICHYISSNFIQVRLTSSWFLLFHKFIVSSFSQVHGFFFFKFRANHRRL